MSRRNDSPGVTGTLWAAAQEKGRPPEPPSQKASLPDRSSHRAATARPDPGLVFILSFYGTWHLLMRIKGSGHLLSVAEGQGHLITRAVSDPVRLAERATEKVRDEPLGRGAEPPPGPPVPDTLLLSCVSVSTAFVFFFSGPEFLKGWNCTLLHL